MLLWLPALIAAILTALITPGLARLLRAGGIVDEPGARRSHVEVTPRGGGLAICAGLVATLVATGLISMSFSLPLAVVPIGFALSLCLLGWLDDRHGLPVAVRFLVHLALAVLMLAWVGGVDSVRMFGHEIEFRWLWSGMAIVAVVWLINLHNFMDGADGLAAMQGLFSTLVLALMFVLAGQLNVAVLGFVIAGACAGFLCWNRPPARIFMGDAGSILLGGLIALLALVGAAEGAVSIWTSLIVCSLFVVDATGTLVLRLVRGERWYTPHRNHAYQRLIVGGWGHGRVLLLYTALNLFLVMPVAVFSNVYPDLDVVLAFGLVVILSFGWYIVQSGAKSENNKA